MKGVVGERNAIEKFDFKRQMGKDEVEEYITVELKAFIVMKREGDECDLWKRFCEY